MRSMQAAMHLLMLTVAALFHLSSAATTSGSPALQSSPELQSPGDKSSSSFSSRRKAGSPPQLLVISLDGFRYDYYDSVVLSSLRSLAGTGVHASNGMKGVFSTVTFASHWTIANGLYEESHGLIGNKFYDPVIGESFDKKSEERHWFGGEPVWVTAKKSGKSVGVYFWIGSATDFGPGVRPDHYFRYNESISLEQRVDTIVDWLSDEDLDLVMMYWHQPDGAGHKTGAGSQQVIKELEHIDVQLMRMLDMMRQREILNHVNIMILADHGMMNRSLEAMDEGVIEIPIYDPELGEHVDRVIGDNVVLHFWTKAGAEDRVFDFLQELSEEKDDAFEVWRKADLPSRWHYGNNARVAPVVAIAAPGFMLLQQRNSRPESRTSAKSSMARATHGYDNNTPEMRALFLASGPDFKQNFSFTETIHMVNMYPLMCHLLRIEPAPCNGSFADVSFLTRGSVTERRWYNGPHDAHSSSLSSLDRGSWVQNVIIIAASIIIFIMT